VSRDSRGTASTNEQGKKGNSFFAVSNHEQEGKGNRAQKWTDELREQGVGANSQQEGTRNKSKHILKGNKQ
jgi:hypothetical protein